jgi:hypothetical protein
LDAAITVAGLPSFTVSVGVVEARHDEDLPALTSRADAALFQAKHDGRDRVIIRDDLGNTVVHGMTDADVVNQEGRLLFRDDEIATVD